MSAPQLIGRRSSHFTRATRIFAHALDVPLELVVVHDITSADPSAFAGNPALKLPSLRESDQLLIGTENICRRLAELARRPARIVWPEALTSTLARNAQELVWHAMAAQVQWVMGTIVGRLPADHPYFAKGRAGLEGALRWLDSNLGAALEALPHPRDLSLLEVTLYCLVEHLTFRQTLSVAPYPVLADFAQRFGACASARETAYAFDPAPAG